MAVTPIFDRELTLNVSAPTAAESGIEIDVLLDRSVVHSRAGYTLFAMDRWGIPTLNSSGAVTICDDKARASMVLEAPAFLHPAPSSPIPKNLP
jgi:glutathione synthase/RimK-type ligase-like ATP-grasp enzyme